MPKARLRQPRSRLRAPLDPMRAFLLAGVGVSLFAAGQAHAKPPSSTSPFETRRRLPPPPPLPDDGLGPRDIYLEADTLIDDRVKNVVTARGHVEARYGGRTVRADELIYNRITGAAHARGDAVIVNPDGTIQYGQDIQLDDQLRTGVAIGFATRENPNVTLAAGAAIRRTETVQQLNDAIYTPCDICNAVGAPKTPTWSIQATRIIQDRDHAVIYYRNAIIRVKGVPVFYFPIFWHPDPGAARRSGFLAPRIQITRKRGFSYEQPYLWAISPYADAVISPQFNSRVTPFLNARYRQRFYSGFIDLRGGVTNEKDFDNHNFYGEEKLRSYLLARGQFDIDPDWTAGFGIEKVTDPTLFRRYSIPDVFIDRGPYSADTDRLISQIYTQHYTDDSFVQAGAFNFQSLRAYGRNADGSVIAETSRAFPFVGPDIEARYDPKLNILGGRVRVQASAVVLSRDNAVSSVIDPNGQLTPGPLDTRTYGAVLTPGTAITYTDSRRATLQADWRTAFTFGNGMRLEPFALARGDAYSIGNATTGAVGFTSRVSGRDESRGRALGTLGGNFSWPFIRQISNASIILEPLAQFAISPRLDPSRLIPNEDSVSFQFDETNLFSTNRFPGFDLYEGGARLNLGARASATWDGGHTASILVGKVLRDKPDLVFQPQSGLRGTSSDWIVTAATSPLTGLSLFSRSRLESSTFELRRQELGVNFGSPRLSASVRYLYDTSGLIQQANNASTIGRVENVQVGGQWFFRKDWGVSVTATEDLQTGTTPVAQIGLIYQDECIRLDVVYTHDQVYNNVIGSSDGVAVRLTLATLGDSAPALRNRTAR